METGNQDSLPSSPLVSPRISMNPSSSFAILINTVTNFTFNSKKINILLFLAMNVDASGMKDEVNNNLKFDCCIVYFPIEENKYQKFSVIA